MLLTDIVGGGWYSSEANPGQDIFNIFRNIIPVQRQGSGIWDHQECMVEAMAEASVL